MWSLSEQRNEKAKDDGVFPTEEDLLNGATGESTLETDMMIAEAPKGKAFNGETSDETDCRDAERTTQLESSGGELQGQPDGGWVGDKDKMTLLKDIGIAAGTKYEGHAIKIEPRDRNTQDVYTLAIRPKSMQPVRDNLAANDWVGVCGGSLQDILAHCLKTAAILLALGLGTTTDALGAPSGGYKGGYGGFRSYSTPKPYTAPRTYTAPKSYSTPKPSYTPKAPSYGSSRSSGIGSGTTGGGYGRTSSPWFWYWMGSNSGVENAETDSVIAATSASSEDRDETDSYDAAKEAEDVTSVIHALYWAGLVVLVGAGVIYVAYKLLPDKPV